MRRRSSVTAALPQGCRARPQCSSASSKEEGMNYSPVFNALLGSLDEAARGLLVRRLQPSMPAKVPDQKTWFDPYLRDTDRRMQSPLREDGAEFETLARLQQRHHADRLTARLYGIRAQRQHQARRCFEVVKVKFKVAGGRELLATVDSHLRFPQYARGASGKRNH